MDLWNECTKGNIKGRTFGLVRDRQIPSERESEECAGNMVGRKDGANKQEHVTRESALRKEFEDREAAINKQREVDRREWQDSLWEFEKIMLGRSPYPLLPDLHLVLLVLQIILLDSVMPQSMLFWPINQMDLSMKARKFYQRTGKKIIINGSDTADGAVNVEESSSKAMLAIDGAEVDWSYMTEEEVPTNFALMAFSDSEVLNNKTCSKTYLKSFEDLKSQYDNLRIELNKSKSDLANFKRGLASVEEQLVFYKKNEGMLCDQIDVFKRDASFNESKINALKIQIERLKKEKESNQIKIDNFENDSKSLDKLIGSQIYDNNRKGMGYNAVAPLPIGLFAPPTIDLSNSSLEEFKQPEFEGYGVKVKKNVSENSSNEIKKTSGALIIEDWVSDYDEDETMEKVLKSANVQKPKQADQPRKVSQNPRNNSTNWNTPMSKKLGMVQKPVLNNVKKGTGQREVRPVWNNSMRTNHQNFSNSRRNFTPTIVLTKSGLVPISAARQSSSRTAAIVSTVRPIKTAAPKL
ncbi:hypothetical protein Tco_0194248 [Tanacetum coccineum]